MGIDWKPIWEKTKVINQYFVLLFKNITKDILCINNA